MSLMNLSVPSSLFYDEREGQHDNGVFKPLS
jgi:hypothetical protein